MTLLASCTFPSGDSPASPPPLKLVTVNPNASATPTPFQPIVESFTPLPTLTFLPSLTPLPTLTPSATPTPTSTLTATTAPPSTPETLESLPTSTRPQYTFHVLFDYSGHQLAVDETIRYTNQTNITMFDLVLAVEPNLTPNSFSLETLFLDGITPNYTLDGHRMTITLPKALSPGDTLEVSMRYRLAIPVKHFDKPYGYLGYQANLTEWYPFVVPYDGGWVLHDPWAFGEHLVYDSADFEVNMKVLDEGITVAASAPAEENGEWTRYRLYGARTFVFSASDRYEIAESAVGSVLIRSYYFPAEEGAGVGMLNAAVQAVGLFNVKFAPYPYDSLSVIETESPDGQEYDGLVFLSSDFYDQYGGSNRSNMVSIGVHEIAHNWWFGLVGNDQALEPWLDEAMSVYSERIFYEFTNPNYGDWWWNFRVNYFNPSGWVDTSIYGGADFRTYTNAVYLDGAYFLEDLRVRMGDQDFYRFLKDYASQYSNKRVTGADFFAVVRENTNANIDDLIQIYFQGSY
ncbi:MAG: M1 family metallopeptidase [Anaerolineales bacterium]